MYPFMETLFCSQRNASRKEICITDSLQAAQKCSITESVFMNFAYAACKLYLPGVAYR